MRFEAVLKKDKLKVVEPILNLAISIVKARMTTFQVSLIYVASQNQIRIIIKSQEAPIVIVLMFQMFYKIESSSKSNTQNTTIGFEFKNGLRFLEQLSYAIKIDTSGSTIVLQDDNSLQMKLSKAGQFRYLELKVKDRCQKLEIEKPTKNQNQLFSCEWIDGMTNGQVYFQVNPTHLTQILKFISKSKSSYPIQMLEDKVVPIQISFSERRMKLRLKAPTSLIQSAAIITTQEGTTNKNYMYQVKIDDCEMLLLTIQLESCFIINENNEIAITYNTEGLFNCQISLRNWVCFIHSMDQEAEFPMLKAQF